LPQAGWDGVLEGTKGQAKRRVDDVLIITARHFLEQGTSVFFILSSPRIQKVKVATISPCGEPSLTSVKR
jgi:hypothetical protein